MTRQRGLTRAASLHRPYGIVSERRVYSCRERNWRCYAMNVIWKVCVLVNASCVPSLTTGSQGSGRWFGRDGVVIQLAYNVKFHCISITCISTRSVVDCMLTLVDASRRVTIACPAG